MLEKQQVVFPPVSPFFEILNARQYLVTVATLNFLQQLLVSAHAKAMPNFLMILVTVNLPEK